MSYVLGIDVGTTRTSAAISRAGTGPADIEVVALGDRASSVPSVLYLGTDGAVVVGEAAERRAVTDSDRVVREFKRRIGDPTPIVVDGRPWAPEELSARLARWVVDRVAQRQGGPAARAAVTHPASWGAHKKDLMGAALAAQGLQVMFLAEPQAAALHYAATERVEPGSTIAVYDLGGGTFDAAVVHKDAAGTFGLLGRPEGLERLGGVDFDDVVFEHVRESMPDAFAALDEDDPAALSAVATVRRECREAKEALSSDTEVSIPVLMAGARGAVRLHRSEFEAMIRPQVEETVTALRRAIASAGCTPEQLTAVLLVGGSSRIPLVGELVSQQLGRPVAVDTDPKNAIAKGAALSLTPAAASATGAQVPAPRSDTGARPPVGPLPPPGFPGGTATGAYGARSGTGGLPPQQRAGTAGPMPARQGPPPPRPAAVGSGAGSYGGGGDYGGQQDDGWGYESAEDRRPARRSPAVLVSAGGAAAAVAVIAAAFLWPHTTTTTTPAGQVASQLPVTVAPTTSVEPTPEPTTAPPRTRERPPVTKVPVIPTPPPTTTVVPPTTTKPPPTSATTPPTSPVPTATPTPLPNPQPNPPAADGGPNPDTNPR